MKAVLSVLLAAWSTATFAWVYLDDKDPMGGSVRSAVVMSNNAINFGPPYSGSQKGRLDLRIHPRHGRDVMLSVQRGQFLCRMDGCTVMIRFDDKQPIAFRAVEPADHSSDAIFIRDYPRFLRETRSAKLVRIEATFFQQGSRVFEFDVAGLNFDAANKPAAAKPAPTPAEKQAATAALQARMKACNSDAAGMKGEERRAFMSQCLATTLK